MKAYFHIVSSEALIDFLRVQLSWFIRPSSGYLLIIRSDVTYKVDRASKASYLSPDPVFIPISTLHFSGFNGAHKSVASTRTCFLIMLLDRLD